MSAPEEPRSAWAPSFPGRSAGETPLAGPHEPLPQRNPSPVDPAGSVEGFDGFAAGTPGRGSAGGQAADIDPNTGRPPGISAFGDQRTRVPGATLTGLPDAPPPGRTPIPARLSAEMGGSPVRGSADLPVRGSEALPVRRSAGLPVRDTEALPGHGSTEGDGSRGTDENGGFPLRGNSGSGSTFPTRRGDSGGFPLRGVGAEGDPGGPSSPGSSPAGSDLPARGQQAPYGTPAAAPAGGAFNDSADDIPPHPYGRSTADSADPFGRNGAGHQRSAASSPDQRHGAFPDPFGRSEAVNWPAGNFGSAAPSGQQAQDEAAPLDGPRDPDQASPFGRQTSPFGRHPEGQATPFGGQPDQGSTSRSDDRPDQGRARPFGDRPDQGQASPLVDRPAAARSSFDDVPSRGQAAPFGARPDGGPAQTSLYGQAVTPDAPFANRLEQRHAASFESPPGDRPTPDAPPAAPSTFGDQPTPGQSPSYGDRPTPGQSSPFDAKPEQGHGAPFGDRPAPGQTSPFSGTPGPGQSAPFGTPGPGQSAPFGTPGPDQSAPFGGAAGQASPAGGGASDAHALYRRPEASAGDHPYPQRTSGAAAVPAVPAPTGGESRNGSVPQPRDPAEHGGPAVGSARPVTASASVPSASRAPAEPVELPPPSGAAPQARIYGRAAPAEPGNGPSDQTPPQHRDSEPERPAPFSGAAFAGGHQSPGSPNDYQPSGSPNDYQPSGSPNDYQSPGGLSDHQLSSSPNDHQPSGSPNDDWLPGRPSDDPFPGGPRDEQFPAARDQFSGPRDEQSAGRANDDQSPGDAGIDLFRGGQDDDPFPTRPRDEGRVAFPPRSHDHDGPGGGPGGPPGGGLPPVNGLAPQSPARASVRASASARVAPPGAQPAGPEQRSGPPHVEFTDRSRGSRPGFGPEQYSELTTDISGRPDSRHAPAPAMPPGGGFPPGQPGPDHGAFPGPGTGSASGPANGPGAGSANSPGTGSVNGLANGPGTLPTSRATVTPPSPDDTRNWPTSGSEQNKFDQFKQADPPAAKPETPHVRMLPILIAVVIAGALLLGLGFGIVFLVAGGDDKALTVTRGECVKRNGDAAVKASCSDAASFEVVSIEADKDRCADARQPYVVNPTTDGKTQVLCLKPRG